MLVTNQELWLAKTALAALLNEPWPVKTSYALAKLARQIGEHYALLDEVRVKLIEQYGESNERGQVVISQESVQWPAFSAAFTELLNEQVEVAAERIPLPPAENLRLTPATLMALDSFVEVTWAD